MEKFSKGVILGGPHPPDAVQVARRRWSVKVLPNTRFFTSGFGLRRSGWAVVTSSLELI